MKKLSRNSEKCYWLEYLVDNKVYGICVSRENPKWYSVDYKNIIIFVYNNAYNCLVL